MLGAPYTVITIATPMKKMIYIHPCTVFIALTWVGFLKPKTYEIAFSPLRDLQRYQELVWLDRYNYLPALFSFVVLWGLGETYNPWVPGSIVDGTFVLFWGGVLRVVLVWHATWSVNSICHLWGTRPFHTKDQSRNNSLIALITMGKAGTITTIMTRLQFVRAAPGCR